LLQRGWLTSRCSIVALKSQADTIFKTAQTSLEAAVQELDKFQSEVSESMHAAASASEMARKLDSDLEAGKLPTMSLTS
jgi:hypothetical protein